jgi:beta-lactamase class D
MSGAALRALVGSALALVAVVAPAAASAAVQHRPGLERYFESAGTTGTMVVQRSGDDRQKVVVGGARSRRRYLPSSTFKIPNALLAIDTGVASGAAQAYPGPNENFLVDGARLLPRECEGDLTLAGAFAFSCIPIFQQLAREIGAEVYERQLRHMRYGNHLIHHAPLDSFWLEGPFGISAHEQVRFLESLRRRALPVSGHALAEVHDMMVLESIDDAVLRGKTGYVFTTSPRVGWWVGWVERAGASWSFALNLDITAPEHFGARTAIGRAILRELGALPTVR